MLKRPLKAASAALVLAAFATPAAVAPALAASGPVVGQPAPAFTGTDSNGKSISLADFKGKLVVLEWTNHGCPYVQKHYDTGNMQRVQKAARDNGVVWLSIISSAPGTQGYVKGEEANALTQKRDAVPHHVVLDPKGVIGRKYKASNTPHMFVVGPDGKLLYMGAIDDKPTARRSSVDGANNYVLGALEAIKAGNTVDPASTQAYGCTVKYGS